MLNAAEAKDNTLDRELLACITAIRLVCCLVESWAFKVYTNHKPLTYLLAKQAGPWSSQQQHHLAHVAQYTAEEGGVILKKKMLHIVCCTKLLLDPYSKISCLNVRVGHPFFSKEHSVVCVLLRSL